MRGGGGRQSQKRDRMELSWLSGRLTEKSLVDQKAPTVRVNGDINRHKRRMPDTYVSRDLLFL